MGIITVGLIIWLASLFINSPKNSVQVTQYDYHVRITDDSTYIYSGMDGVLIATIPFDSSSKFDSVMLKTPYNQ
jgi:hypothetical protein